MYQVSIGACTVFFSCLDSVLLFIWANKAFGLIDIIWILLIETVHPGDKKIWLLPVDTWVEEVKELPLRPSLQIWGKLL